MLSIEYLAGLFDGEGCIHIPLMKHHKTPSYGLRVIFSLTHEEVINRIAKQYGVAYCRLRKNHMNVKWKDAYQVQICGERAAQMLRDMFPFLIVKLEEAKVGLLLQDHITRYRSGWKRRTQEEIDAIVEYREGIRLQLKALRRLNASDGMTANSVETPCPASNGAEGQYRAKLRSV